jgi:hypothetical protein
MDGAVPPAWWRDPRCRLKKNHRLQRRGRCCGGGACESAPAVDRANGNHEHRGMPVFLVAFNTHPVDSTPEQARRAEMRAGGLRSIVERRFAPECRRSISENVYFIDTQESLVTLSAFSESADEVYVVPLSEPVQGASADTIDTFRWLRSRLSNNLDDSQS